MLKAIHAQEDRKAAQTKAAEIITRLKAMKLKAAAELVEQPGPGDAHLLCLSLDTLAADPDQQSTRTYHPRDQTADTGGRSVPRWPLGIDVGRGQTQAHRLDQVGKAALPRHGAAAQPSKAGGGSMNRAFLPGLRPVRLHLGFAVRRG